MLGVRLFSLRDGVNYEEAIISILQEAGREGISIMKISRHVYNACNSLFEPKDFCEVHKYVAKFLAKKSKDTSSPIARAKTRGRYRINMKLMKAQPIDNPLPFE